MKISDERLSRIFPMKKSPELLCGEACVAVICRLLQVPYSASMDCQRRWAPALACELLEKGFQARLYCSPASRLMNDYMRFRDDASVSLEVFTAIRDYLSYGNAVNTVQLREEEVTGLLADGSAILLVDSAEWNEDGALSGGHFVLLLSESDDCYWIANPQRDEIQLGRFPKAKVMRALDAAGGWAIQ